MTTNPIIQVRDLHHAYHHAGVSEPVLHGLDLDIPAGAFTVIMGPSGCGKTTLLNILGLMLRPSRAARITIAGTDTHQLADGGRTALRRAKVGFVFQRFNLLPTLSIRRNVELPIRIRGAVVDGQVEPLLERVGLAQFAHKKPGQLSVGQQQRVAIARAVVTRPPILLADEPTGNLDSKNAAGVLELLEELHREQQQTIVMITHNEHLTVHADRILHMRDGRFVD